MIIKVKCSRCKKVFSRSNGQVKEARKFKWHQYCSTACMARSYRRGHLYRCSNPACKRKFYRAPHDLKKVRQVFCSRSCAARINNEEFRKRKAFLGICAYKECGVATRLPAKYCSVKCRWDAERKKPIDLIASLERLAKKLGRTPAKREAPEISEACIHAFGSWNHAINKAGLVPHRSHSQRMYKRTNTVALDGHKCDSISEAIVDNWLTKNRIPHLRNISYPGTGHKADWSIKNKIFIEYFGLAHDSPRYDRSIKQKRKLCEQNNIQLIEVYARDLYPVIKLDERFRAVVHG